MARCSVAGVKWAIFSDRYGVWFPEVRNRWYEKDPNTVTESEFRALLTNFDTALAGFDEIHFYHNPGRFHPLYRRLIESSTLKNRIRPVSHLEQHIDAPALNDVDRETLVQAIANTRRWEGQL